MPHNMAYKFAPVAGRRQDAFLFNSFFWLKLYTVEVLKYMKAYSFMMLIHLGIKNVDLVVGS